MVFLFRVTQKTLWWLAYVRKNFDPIAELKITAGHGTNSSCPVICLGILRNSKPWIEIYWHLTYPINLKSLFSALNSMALFMCILIIFSFSSCSCSQLHHIGLTWTSGCDPPMVWCLQFSTCCRTPYCDSNPWPLILFYSWGLPQWRLQLLWTGSWNELLHDIQCHQL